MGLTDIQAGISELKAEIAKIEHMMQDPAFYSSAQEHL